MLRQRLIPATALPLMSGAAAGTTPATKHASPDYLAVTYRWTGRTRGGLTIDLDGGASRQRPERASR